MSYILDALRKAEMERELSRVPGISSPQQYARAAGLFQARMWLPLAAALVAGVSITWLWLRHDVPFHAQVPETSNTGSSARTDNAAQPKASAKSMAPAALNPRVLNPAKITAAKSKGRAALTAVEDEKSDEPVAPVTADGNALNTDTKLGVEPPLIPRQEPAGSDTAEASATVKTVVEPGNDRQPVDVMAMIAAEAELGWPEDRQPHPAQSAQGTVVNADNLPGEEATKEETLPPLLSTLPYRFQSTLPKIVINAQAYADEPEARFVIINMKKYREGERTQEGIVVELIGKDLLVLSYQGQPFRMQR